MKKSPEKNTSKKNFLTVLLIALPALVIIWIYNGRKNNAGTDPAENAVEQIAPSTAQLIILQDSTKTGTLADTVELGKVRSGEILSKPLTVKNGGEEPVVIIDVDKTCGCLDVEYPRQPLKPGDKAPLDLQFDSRGIKGWTYKTLILKTSSEGGEHLIVVTADVE